MSNYHLATCPYCESAAIFMDDGNVGNPLHIDCSSGSECLGNTALYPRQDHNELIVKWNTRPVRVRLFARIATQSKQLQIARDAIQKHINKCKGLAFGDCFTEDLSDLLKRLV